jgi:hypothetical protein
MCTIQFGAINPHEQPVRIVYVPEEIPAEYLSNTILERYHYTTCWTSDVLAIILTGTYFVVFFLLRGICSFKSL